MRHYVLLLAAVITISATSSAWGQMKLTKLSSLPKCEPSELQQIAGLFYSGRGGAGGSIIKLDSTTNSLILYPGKVSSDSTGGSGANLQFNLQNGAVIRIEGSEQGLVVSIPGFRGVIGWDLVDDLSRKSRVE